MSMMKRFAEQVSEDMGYDGELTKKVLQEAQRQLNEIPTKENQPSEDRLLDKENEK